MKTLLSLVLLAFTAPGYASTHLDDRVWTMRLPEDAQHALFRVVENRGLGRDSPIERVVRMPDSAWDSVPASILRVIRKRLAWYRLHTGMSKEDVQSLRQDPYQQAFAPLECGPRAVRELQLSLNIYVNRQLVEYAADVEAQYLFAGFARVARQEALECLAKTRARLDPVEPTSLMAFEVRTFRDARARSVDDVLPSHMAFNLKEYGALASIGDVMDRTFDQISAVLGMGGRSTNDLRKILSGHGLSLFGEEFARYRMPADLNRRLANHGVRTPDRLVELAAAPDQRAEAPTLTADDLSVVRDVASQIKVEVAAKLECCRHLLGTTRLP